MFNSGLLIETPGELQRELSNFLIFQLPFPAKSIYKPLQLKWIELVQPIIDYNL